MKRTIMTIVLACAAIFMTQCKKTTMEQPNGGMPDMINVTLNVDDGHGSKTSIAESGVVEWKQNDKIYVVGEITGLLGCLKAESSGTNVKFSGAIKLIDETQKFHFYYVGNTNEFTIDENGEYTYSIAVQHGTLAHIGENLHLMHGVSGDYIVAGQTYLGTVGMDNMMAIAHVTFMQKGEATEGIVNCYGAYASAKLEVKTGNLVSPEQGHITLNDVENTDYYMVMIPSVSSEDVQTFMFTREPYAVEFDHVISSGELYNYGDAKVLDLTADEDYVDLGLSVLWAKSNLGATCGEEMESWFGDYYAWGELVPYRTRGAWNDGVWNTEPTLGAGGHVIPESGYGWKTYCNSNNDKFTEWTTKPYDNNGVLKPEYDVARQIRGIGWRIPTKKECEELLECTKVVRKNKGGTHTFNDGTQFVFPSNGRLCIRKDDDRYYIFLPENGVWDKTSINHSNDGGAYWTSSVNTSDKAEAWYLNPLSSEFGHGINVAFSNRRRGEAIRPVHDK